MFFVGCFLCYIFAGRYGVFWNIVSLENIDLFRFKSVMEKFDIDAAKEIMLLPVETVDRRSLWKKDMDMRMGRTVDFRTPNNHLTPDPVRMERALSQILVEKEI